MCAQIVRDYLTQQEVWHETHIKISGLVQKENIQKTGVNCTRGGNRSTVEYVVSDIHGDSRDEAQTALHIQDHTRWLEFGLMKDHH